MTKDKLGDDLLRGCGQIAAYVFGTDTPENRRRIYNLRFKAKNKNRPAIPVFNDGSNILHARRTELDAFYSAKRQKQESAPAA